MKFISSKLSALATMGLLSLALNTQAAACNVTDAIGKWGYSAQGINVAAGGIPFSEIGAFTLKADGTGKGVAHHVTNGIYIPNIPVT
ncbi:MAG TPA: hypothetical protein VM532_13760, partial [Burkholderiales bacterium]|nr:hypothetical protein [Burkholderiales bacterium]